MDSSSLSFSESSDETLESLSLDSHETDFVQTLVPQRPPFSPPRPAMTRKRRKKRKTLTSDIVKSFIMLFNMIDGPSLKEIAKVLDITYPTAKKLVRRIREGRYDFEDGILYNPTKKWRKTLRTTETKARVKTLLTETTTATLACTKELLEVEDIFISQSTIYRIALDEKLSNQKVSLKPEISFSQRTAERRHEYAVQVSDLLDEELWFLDESGFNLHIAPLRSWSAVGQTPVEAVPTNKEQNLSLLMCIAPDGIKHFELRDGSFTATPFVAFVQELAEQFTEVQRGTVCLVMDNARIHHAREARQYLEENQIRHLYLPPILS